MKESEKIAGSSKSEAGVQVASSLRGQSSNAKIGNVVRERGRKKIAIVGVGLIGGSLAIQLHEKKLSSKLIGVDLNEEHAKQAVELELVDETMTLDNAIEQSDVIILAIPVDALVKLLPSIMDK